MLFLGPLLRGISVSLWFIGATCIGCVCDQLESLKTDFLCSEFHHPNVVSVEGRTIRWSVPTMRNGHSLSCPSYILIISRPGLEWMLTLISLSIYNLITPVQWTAEIWLLKSDCWNLTAEILTAEILTAGKFMLAVDCHHQHHGDWWLWTPSKNLVNYCKMSVQMVGKPSQWVSHYHSTVSVYTIHHLYIIATVYSILYSI